MGKLRHPAMTISQTYIGGHWIPIHTLAEAQASGHRAYNAAGYSLDPHAGVCRADGCKVRDELAPPFGWILSPDLPWDAEE